MNARSSSPLPRPLLLLLLASTLAVLGESLNGILPASCPAEYSGQIGMWMTLPVKNRKAERTFYLHPGQGFKGVGVSSKKTRDHLAWIPLPETCFPDDKVVWWKMEVETGWILDTNGQNNTLALKSKTGICNNVLCVQAAPYNASIRSLVFHIDGPSGYRGNKPDQEDCHTMEEIKGDLHVVNCTAPDLATIFAPVTTPAPATPPTHPAPATTPAPASYAEAVGVGVLVLVLVSVALAGVLLALAMMMLKQIDEQTKG